MLCCENWFLFVWRSKHQRSLPHRYPSRCLCSWHRLLSGLNTIIWQQWTGTDRLDSRVTNGDWSGKQKFSRPVVTAVMAQLGCDRTWTRNFWTGCCRNSHFGHRTPWAVFEPINSPLLAELTSAEVALLYAAILQQFLSIIDYTTRFLKFLTSENRQRSRYHSRASVGLRSLTRRTDTVWCLQSRSLTRRTDTVWCLQSRSLTRRTDTVCLVSAATILDPAHGYCLHGMQTNLGTVTEKGRISPSGSSDMTNQPW